jgi:lipoprotein-anchoring transpeptidase ErfK/SrfK
VYLRARIKTRKSKRGAPFRSFASLFYAALCAGLVGGFGWFWWQSSHNSEPAPKPLPAPAPAATPPVVVNKHPAQPAALPRIQAPAAESQETRPVETLLEAQIALVDQGICPGSIDGVAGSQTVAALMAFQKKRGLPQTGSLDAQTKALLLITQSVTTEYTVTAEDVGRIMAIPKTWLGKSGQTRLDFENIPELLGEKAFSSPQLIRSLNPGIDWSQIASGATVTLPRVDYPPVSAKAAFVKISLQHCVLEAFDSATNLLVHFPCSIGRVAAKRPAGELHVTAIALDPNYTFDPTVFPESPEAQSVGRKLILPPGPNNPVGVAWIGLDRPGYGIHGTPAPEQVGRTESHGCFRLANWNASYLAKLVWVGMEVIVE